MKYCVLTLLLAGLFLNGCGEDKPVEQGTKVPAMEKPAPAGPVPLPEIVVSDDDDISYEPIDVSKLDNEWWQQYSGGG